MGDHDANPTCLSALPHTPKVIRDFAMHYFGCIEICDRPDFLDRLKNREFWDEEVGLEQQKLKQQSGHEGSKIEDFKAEAEQNIQKKIGGLAATIESQYKRIDTLRKALQQARCTHLKDTQDVTGCNLVECLVESHDKWRQEPGFAERITRINDWRNKKREAEGRTVDNSLPDQNSMDKGRLAVREIIKKTHKDVDFVFQEDTKPTKYELERDINGYIIQWKVLPDSTSESETSVEHLDSALHNLSPTPRKPKTQQHAQRPSFGRQESGSALSHRSYYKSSSREERYLIPVEEEQNDYRFKGHFPDQKLSLQYLLGKEPQERKDDVILDRNRHRDRNENEDRVRYIHIPHNNMKWIEEAIACYFRDENPDHGRIHREHSLKTRSHMILRPEYWRGQQHGGKQSMVHARHMRAICERISSEMWDSEDSPENLVLFMPYLHWEEDRKRDKIAKIIEEESEKCRERQKNIQKEAKEKRIEERTFNGNKLTSDRERIKHQEESSIHSEEIRKAWEQNSFGKFTGKHQRTFTGLAEGLAEGGPIQDEQDEHGHKHLWYVAKLDTNEHGRVKARSRLGQFLLDAARLYEAMAIYRDQQLLEQFLHNDPPLHPRRTLDQSYYWTLKTTKARDRDQVVYRETAMDERNVHRFRESGEKPTDKKRPIMDRLLGRQPPQPADEQDKKQPKPTMLGEYRWDDHSTKTDDDGCDHCRGEIKKVSRIVMVDQLWMWILDKRTIITSFPKRYGSIKQDASGVHKSIRMRINNARKNQIRSVFDVALIILDECSNTFFDRTKTPDRHPQVMDIFAESIGNLTNKQTISFQHLWHWTERASKIYSSKSTYEDASHLHFPLLNINPEGKLQREIKDIIDELDIMIYVNNKQKEVIKRFTKHVESIYDATGVWRDEMISPDIDRDYRRARSRAPSPESGERTDAESHRLAKKREKEEFVWFFKQAYDLISDVSDRITELEGLKKSAESTSQGIKDLLDLKQQQASILQAWQSVKQADESVRQGRSIMIFTIVTIIFLPLSFMSSIFGMNNRDIGSENMSFRDQANFMFPISAAVILVSLVFAFRKFPRTLIWAGYKYLETCFLVKTGIYQLWLDVREKPSNLKTDTLLKSLSKEVTRMKGEVKKQRQKNKKKEHKEQKTEENDKTRQQPVEQSNAENGRSDCDSSMTDDARTSTTDRSWGMNGFFTRRPTDPTERV